MPRTAAIDEEGSRGPSGVHTARCRTPPSPRRRSSRAHPLHTPAAKQRFGRYVGRGVNDVRRRRRSRDASACASFIDPRRCLAPARSRNVPECSESRCSCIACVLQSPPSCVLLLRWSHRVLPKVVPTRAGADGHERDRSGIPHIWHTVHLHVTALGELGAKTASFQSHFFRCRRRHHLRVASELLPFTVFLIIKSSSGVGEFAHCRLHSS